MPQYKLRCSSAFRIKAPVFAYTMPYRTFFVVKIPAVVGLIETFYICDISGAPRRTRAICLPRRDVDAVVCVLLMTYGSRPRNMHACQNRSALGFTHELDTSPGKEEVPNNAPSSSMDVDMVDVANATVDSKSEEKVNLEDMFNDEDDMDEFASSPPAKVKDESMSPEPAPIP